MSKEVTKYVIEIPDDISFNPQFLTLYGVEPKGDYVRTYDIEMDEAEELNSDYINEHFGDLQDTAYQKGVNDGSLDVKQRVEGAYQRGLNDACEAAKKVVLNSDEGGLSALGLNEIFNCATIQQVFRKYTLSEVIAKLKAYEEKQKADDEIKVGDEVIYNGTTKCIVVRPEDDERYASLIDGNGTHHCADHCECKKTGRHFDIASILEAMKK